MKRVLYIFLIFIFTIGLISIFNLDIKTSSLLYDKPNNSWIYYHFFLWNFLYLHGNLLPNLIAIVSFVALLVSITIKRFSFIKRKALFACLVFLIGPGFIAQTLKVTWGRPRPVEVLNYGGTFEFRTPFEPNFKLAGDTNNGNAFPSGHAAMGFYTMVVYFIFRKKWILCAAVLYGVLMSAARMAVGAHFLSDVVSSFFIVYICMELFWYLLLKKQE